MSKIESPTYYVDVEDKETRSRVESAKPGKPVQVRVRCEESPTDEPIVAKGTLSRDSTKFHVLVETSGRQWLHDEDWKELISRVSAYRD